MPKTVQKLQMFLYSFYYKSCGSRVSKVTEIIYRVQIFNNQELQCLNYRTPFNYFSMMYKFNANKNEISEVNLERRASFFFPFRSTGKCSFTVIANVIVLEYVPDLWHQQLWK